MPHPLRLAFIGAGTFARDVHLPSLRALGDAYRVAAVYSRTEATAREFAALLPDQPLEVMTDLDALLARDDIDVLDVLVPITAMPAIVEKALASGKHVLSEKPIAADMATGRRLAALPLQPGQQWMVGENWRYESAFVRAAEWLRAGRIGRPLHMSWALRIGIRPGNKYYATAWRRSGDFPGGFLLDGGIHHIAALRLVLGEIAGVTALVTQMRDDLPPADTLAAALRFDSGVIGTYTVSFAAAAPWPSTLDIVGEQGTMQIDRDGVTLHSGEEETVYETQAQGVSRELEALAAAIHEGVAHRNTAQEALQDLAVVTALLDSAATDKTMTPERVI